MSIGTPTTNITNTTNTPLPSRLVMSEKTSETTIIYHHNIDIEVPQGPFTSYMNPEDGKETVSVDHIKGSGQVDSLHINLPSTWRPIEIYLNGRSEPIATMEDSTYDTATIKFKLYNDTFRIDLDFGRKNNRVKWICMYYDLPNLSSQYITGAVVDALNVLHSYGYTQIIE